MSVLYLNICMDKEELFLLHSLGWGYPDVHNITTPAAALLISLVFSSFSHQPQSDLCTVFVRNLDYPILSWGLLRRPSRAPQHSESSH